MPKPKKRSHPARSPKAATSVKHGEPGGQATPKSPAPDRPAKPSSASAADDALRPHIFAFAFGGAALAVMIVGGIYAAFFWLPAQLTRGESLKNIQQLSVASEVYVFDADGRLPLAGSWMGALTPFTPLDSHCLHAPSLARHGGGADQFGLAMNEAFSGAEAVTAVKQAVYFESKSYQWNASGRFPNDSAARYIISDAPATPFAGIDGTYGWYSPSKRQLVFAKPAAAGSQTGGFSGLPGPN